MLGAEYHDLFCVEHVPKSQRNRALNDLSQAEWTAILLSLRIAAVATIMSLPFGIFTAYALARWQFPGKMIVNGIVHLPLVLPPVVTGFLLLVLFGHKGAFGAFLAQFGIVLAFRWTGAAVACAVMAFPLMVRAIRLSFEAIDRRLELAARTLGASPIWTFFLVSLPLAIPGIAAGSILAFAKALGEFGATITFVSNIPGETQTIASAIYSFTQVPGGDESAMRLTVVAVAISFAALAASEFVQRQAEKRLASF
jgi:molybdate transport system permease protein